MRCDILLCGIVYIMWDLAMKATITDTMSNNIISLVIA